MSPDGQDIVGTPDEVAEIDAFLAQRIYEHNAAATGYVDAAPFAAVRRDTAGRIVAGISGYTWGGCCHVAHLWVQDADRGQGIGHALLAAAEDNASALGCALITLSTHSFQAPGFYEGLGYLAEAVVRDHPRGYSNIVLSKTLRPRTPAIDR